MLLLNHVHYTVNHNGSSEIQAHRYNNKLIQQSYQKLWKAS